MFLFKLSAVINPVAELSFDMWLVNQCFVGLVTESELEKLHLFMTVFVLLCI